VPRVGPQAEPVDPPRMELRAVHVHDFDRPFPLAGNPRDEVQARVRLTGVRDGGAARLSRVGSTTRRPCPPCAAKPRPSDALCGAPCTGRPGTR
jgi:hypothetical protein